MSQAKAWTFTSFHYDEKSVDALQGKADAVELLCFQEEKCPASGRIHLQGFIRFKTNQRLGAVKRWVGDDSAHLEIAKGSSQSNLDYCSKADSQTGRFRFQNGDFSKGGVQGARTDLDMVIEAIKDGDTMESLNDKFPREIIKFGRGIQLSRSLFLSRQAPSTFPRTVIVLYGRSGAGKSLWARQFAQRNSLSVYAKNLTKSSDTQWFDGYDGESLLLLDDFTDQAVSFRELLIWTDIYKHRIQIKGTMCVAQWSHVIITSNVCPNQWYEKYIGAEREPLVRRLDHVLEAPPAPYFCEAIHDLYRSYPGRSPPAVGAQAGPADVGENKDAEPRIPLLPAPSRMQEDPRDYPDFAFTDGLSSQGELLNEPMDIWPSPASPLFR